MIGFRQAQVREPDGERQWLSSMNRNFVLDGSGSR